MFEYKITNSLGTIMNYKNIVIGRIEISGGSFIEELFKISEQLEAYIFDFNDLSNRVSALYDCPIPHAKYICGSKYTLEQLIKSMKQDYSNSVDWNETWCGLNFYDLNLDWDIISSCFILPTKHIAIVGSTEGVQFIKDNTTYYPKVNKKQGTIKEMTIEEIEQVLGYKVKIK